MLNISLPYSRLSNYKVLCVRHRFSKTYNQALTVLSLQIKIKSCKNYFFCVKTLSISKMNISKNFKILM